MQHAFVTGLEGLVLTDAERAFLRTAEPAGLILFARNCGTPEQVRRLIGEAGDAVGADDLLVLVDQEGGRVQRLGPPDWPAYPSAEQYARAFDRREDEGLEDVERVVSHLADGLARLGFNVNCAPVLDLRQDETHDMISTRVLGRDPEIVSALARAFAAGLRTAAIAAVGKHIPGHGRARVDTHDELAIVDLDHDTLAGTDFKPFAALADLPAMMTAHVVFTEIDDTEPASTSRAVHDEIIRGAMAFDGLLFSDDLSMSALEGPVDRRAARVIAAGSDLALHCNGKLDEMEAVCGSVPMVGPKCRDRITALHAWRGQRGAVDMQAAEAALARILADE